MTAASALGGLRSRRPCGKSIGLAEVLKGFQSFFDGHGVFPSCTEISYGFHSRGSLRGVLTFSQGGGMQS